MLNIVASKVCTYTLEAFYLFDAFMMEWMQLVFDYFANNPIDLIATIFGIACVYLNLKENIWGWPAGIISVGLLIYVFLKSRLYGDFILHIFYVIMGLYGWYHWYFGGKEKDDLPITHSPKKEIGWLILLSVISIAGMGYIFENYFPNPALPYWDATTTVLSLVAQWQLAQKRLENWLNWICIDILCVGIYYYKELYILCGLYLIYLGLATWGFFHWKSLMQTKST